MITLLSYYYIGIVVLVVVIVIVMFVGWLAGWSSLCDTLVRAPTAVSKNQPTAFFSLRRRQSYIVTAEEWRRTNQSDNSGRVEELCWCSEWWKPSSPPIWWWWWWLQPRRRHHMCDYYYVLLCSFHSHVHTFFFFLLKSLQLQRQRQFEL